ncbi:hypothetical protein [Niveispirillum sp.]|uniref:hypothetical protein n=1 Tax=Niveispirillum sp. TaxID=1917217 RepID=UPI001B5CC62B|nr:hypothetical protein [Niveispirillum sp.]MBP7338266.1 hypothetical protein [Niveispirillum sp.]
MSNADDIRAGFTILNDFKLFNKTVVYYETHMEPRVYAEIAEFLSGWLRANGWQSTYKPKQELTALWVRPLAWDGHAWFQLERRRNASNSYQLADLCGVGEDRFGFRFRSEYDWKGGADEWIALLVGHGWEHEGNGVYFLPVTLPAGQLALAWQRDDLRPAFEPLERALDRLKEDIVHFDRMLAMLKR